MAAEDNITIRVGLEDELSAPAAEVDVSLREIEERAREAARALARLTREERAAGRAALRLAAEQEVLQHSTNRMNRMHSDAIKINKKFDDDLKRGSQVLTGAVASLEKFSSKLTNALKPLKKLSEGITKFASVLFKAFKFAFIIKGIQTLGSVIGALGGVSFIAMQKSGPLSGMLTAYPGLALAAAQGMGVMKIAISGVGDAVTNLSSNVPDMVALSKSLINMGPHTQAAVYGLAALNKTYLNPMKQAVQESFWTSVGSSFQQLRGILPLVSTQLQATGTALGGVVKHALTMASSPIFKSDLATIMSTNTVVIGRMGQGVLNLISAFAHYMALARPFMLWLSGAFERATANLDAWIHSIRGESAVTKYLGHTVIMMKELGHIIADVFRMWRNVAHAAAGSTGAWGNTITMAFDKWTAWTASLNGQNKLHTFFVNAQIVAVAFFKLIGAILMAFASLGNPNSGAAKFMDQLRAIIPALKQLWLIATFVSGVLFSILAWVAGHKTTTKVLILIVVTLHSLYKVMKLVIGIGRGLIFMWKNFVKIYEFVKKQFGQ